GTNSAEKKPRHTDHFSIFDGVDRSAGGNASDQTHLAHCIRRDVSHVHSQCERAVVVATLNQAALLKRADMFGDRSFRANAEVPRYLCVRRFVTVFGEKPSDVVENFFLTLCPG